MAGSREQGLKAAATIKAKYGDGFYQEIGSKSSENWKLLPPEERKPRGFSTMDKDRLKQVSRQGGRNKKGKRHHGV